jgi:hypothetical protein
VTRPNDCWTPGLVAANLKAGRVVPEDWAQRLLIAGYQLSPEIEATLIGAESAGVDTLGPLITKAALSAEPGPLADHLRRLANGTLL